MTKLPLISSDNVIRKLRAIGFMPLIGEKAAI